MTIHLSKLRFGALLLAVTLLVPSAAWATHVFIDVPDTSTFAADIEWASTNGITSGRDGVHFEPGINVTRQESVAFLKRYHDNIVSPAIAANAASISSAPTVYTAQVNNDCTANSQSGGLAFTIRSGFDNICDVLFPVSISTCAWNITPALFGSDLGWGFVAASYASQPPVAWAQVTDASGTGRSLAIHQYKQDGSDADSKAETNNAMWYSLLVTCA